MHLQCFVLLSCCSIFNDRAAALADSLTIISHSFPFVNTFSKTFLLFFKVFSKAFSKPLDSVLVRYLSHSLFRESSSIILLHLPFVKGFYKIYCRISKKYFQNYFQKHIDKCKSILYNISVANWGH